MADNTAILNSFSTMWQVLEENAKTSPNQPAVREKAFGIWQTWSWRDYSENARKLALGLIDLGMEDSSPVAIVGNNRQQLYSAMFSVQMAGGIPIPIYQDAVADEMLHVLQHSESKIIIAEDQEQVDKVIELGEKLPKVEKIIYLEEKSMRSYESEDIISIKSVLSRGENVPDQCYKELESRKSKQTSDTTGVILYTSGTTGKSKGVVLSNANILTAASGAIEFDSLKPGMEIVSYLPMAWVVALEGCSRKTLMCVNGVYPKTGLGIPGSPWLTVQMLTPSMRRSREPVRMVRGLSSAFSTACCSPTRLTLLKGIR